MKPVEAFKASAAAALVAALVMTNAQAARADYGQYEKADNVPEACKKICATQPTACVSCIKSN